MKHSNDKRDCFRMDDTEEAIQDVTSQVHLTTPLEKTLTNSLQVLDDNEKKELEDCMADLEILKEVQPWEDELEILKKDPIEEKSSLELKVLPPHLKYVFLESGGNKPVIINGSLSSNE